MKIAISGSVAIGKTSVAKALSEKLGYKYISINNVAEKINAYVGYDKEMESKILDMEKLRKRIEDIGGNIILDGHVSHEFKNDFVIILRIEPTLLEKRLKKRYPNNPKKVKENLDVEILGVVTTEAILKNKNVYEIDTSKKTIKEIVKNVIEIVNGKTINFRVGKIDWLEKYYSKL